MDNISKKFAVGNINGFSESDSCESAGVTWPSYTIRDFARKRTPELSKAKKAMKLRKVFMELYLMIVVLFWTFKILSTYGLV